MKSHQAFSQFSVKLSNLNRLEIANSAWIDTVIFFCYFLQKNSILLNSANHGSNGILFNTLSGVIKVFRIDFWMVLTEKYHEYFVPFLFGICFAYVILFSSFAKLAMLNVTDSNLLQKLIPFLSTYFIQHLLSIPVMETTFGVILDRTHLSLQIFAVCNLLIVVIFKLFLNWSRIRLPYSKRRPLDEDAFSEYLDTVILPVIVYLSQKAIEDESDALEIVSEALMLAYNLIQVLMLVRLKPRLSKFDRMEIILKAFSFSFTLEMIVGRIKVAQQNFSHLDFPFLLVGCFISWFCMSFQRYQFEVAVNKVFNGETAKKEMLRMFPVIYSNYQSSQSSDSNFIEKIAPHLLFSLMSKQAECKKGNATANLKESADQNNNIPNPLLIEKNLEKTFLTYIDENYDTFFKRTESFSPQTQEIAIAYLSFLHTVLKDNLRMLTVMEDITQSFKSRGYSFGFKRKIQLSLLREACISEFSSTLPSSHLNAQKVFSVIEFSNDLKGKMVTFANERLAFLKLLHEPMLNLEATRTKGRSVLKTSNILLKMVNENSTAITQSQALKELVKYFAENILEDASFLSFQFKAAYMQQASHLKSSIKNITINKLIDEIFFEQSKSRFAVFASKKAGISQGKIVYSTPSLGALLGYDAEKIKSMRESEVIVAIKENLQFTEEKAIDTLAKHSSGGLVAFSIRKNFSVINGAPCMVYFMEKNSKFSSLFIICAEDGTIKGYSRSLLMSADKKITDTINKTTYLHEVLRQKDGKALILENTEESSHSYGLLLDYEQLFEFSISKWQLFDESLNPCYMIVMRPVREYEVAESNERKSTSFHSRPHLDFLAFEKARSEEEHEGEQKMNIFDEMSKIDFQRILSPKTSFVSNLLVGTPVTDLKQEFIEIIETTSPITRKFSTYSQKEVKNTIKFSKEDQRKKQRPEIPVKLQGKAQNHNPLTRIKKNQILFFSSPIDSSTDKFDDLRHTSLGSGSIKSGSRGRRIALKMREKTRKWVPPKFIPYLRTPAYLLILFFLTVWIVEYTNTYDRLTILREISGITRFPGAILYSMSLFILFVEFTTGLNNNLWTPAVRASFASRTSFEDRYLAFEQEFTTYVLQKNPQNYYPDFNYNSYQLNLSLPDSPFLDRSCDFHEVLNVLRGYMQKVVQEFSPKHNFTFSEAVIEFFATQSSNFENMFELLSNDLFGRLIHEFEQLSQQLNPGMIIETVASILIASLTFVSTLYLISAIERVLFQLTTISNSQLEEEIGGLEAKIKVLAGEAVTSNAEKGPPLTPKKQKPLLKEKRFAVKKILPLQRNIPFDLLIAVLYSCFLMLPLIIVYNVNYSPISKSTILIKQYQTVTMNSAFSMMVLSSLLSVINQADSGQPMNALSKINQTASTLQNAVNSLRELRDITTTSLNEIQSNRFTSKKLVDSIQSLNTALFCENMQGLPVVCTLLNKGIAQFGVVSTLENNYQIITEYRNKLILSPTVETAYNLTQYEELYDSLILSLSASMELGKVSHIYRENLEELASSSQYWLKFVFIWGIVYLAIFIGVSLGIMAYWGYTRYSEARRIYALLPTTILTSNSYIKKILL